MVLRNQPMLTLVLNFVLLVAATAYLVATSTNPVGALVAVAYMLLVIDRLWRVLWTVGRAAANLKANA